MPPPKSIIWTHFTKTNETIAKCKQCFKSVKYCGNTSNLLKHSKTHGISVDKGKLQKQENKKSNESSKNTIVLASSKHLMEDDQPQASTSKISENRDDCSSVTTLTSMDSETARELFLSNSIKNAFERISSNKAGGTKYNRIVQALIFFICQDMRPFNIVEGEGFLRLVKELEPTFKVPSAKYLKKMTTEKYEACVTIYSHDMVLRFNNAPTVNYTDDVGSKTTFRVLNSQVVTKPEFKFLEDPLYEGISILIWDPANYSSTLEDWYHHPDFPLFPVYKKLLDTRPDADVHLMKPQVLWDLWAVLQDSSPYRLRRNTPSSGFLGLWFALQRCNRVRAFEYVPSARATRRCHYYATLDDAACTLGAWHPLAQEKAIAEQIRDNADLDVFQRGFIDIPGLRTITC